MFVRFRFLTLLALAAILFQSIAPAFSAFAAPAAQASTPEARAQALLDSLTPEERVGQLFLVNFSGTDTSNESEIYDLIVNYHVGGVVLRADHGNITGPENTPATTQSLITRLQETAWLATQQTMTNTLTGEPFTPVHIPLFVAVSQPGDGAPYDQILSGLTELPSQMGLGATWLPQLAEQAGALSGKELSALGFNMLFGPSLDVLENPSAESVSDLGTLTFGGDPFWVAQMGSAYIKGVHTGSNGQMAVIATHFPGVGGADRPLTDEVSTVRKSLEQLKQIELAPFFFVTGDAPEATATVDGLLISHIRYQGFLGNIRATTRPISFDETSFAAILGLEQFASWRETGGLMVTDDLGTRAVSRFYDPTGLSFNARLVVRDAFFAGNDLLYLGDILDTTDQSTHATAVRVLEFFTQKYNEDLAFAQRVDQSLLRILTLKATIYPNFALNDILPRSSNLDTLGTGDQTVFDIARLGATLISPAFEDLDTVIPDAPAFDDRIVFLTDSSTYTQCATCAPIQRIAPAAIQEAVLRLYGPEAGNQVQRRNLTSYTFDDLQLMLNGGTNSVEASLRSASWIVIAMTDIDLERPASLALSQFLAERDDLLRGKSVIVFAFDAPYLLDATEIAKLNAYYALYSKNGQSIDIAARILFKEFAPTQGALPISVSGIGYDLISATAPDPAQTIQVFLDPPEFIESTGADGTPEPTLPPTLELGDQVSLVTGIILDHNGHPVPDGTPIQFVFRTGDIETASAFITTVQGVARTTYNIMTPGSLEISLRTEPQAVITPLIINIPIPEDFTTPLPQTETPTVEPTPEPSLTPTLPPPQITPTPEPPRTTTDLVDWVIAFLASLSVGLAALRTGVTYGQARWSVRWAFAAGIGGLVTYLYLAFGLPGSEAVVLAGRGAMLWLSLGGAGLGWGVGAAWRAITNAAPPPRNTDPPGFADTRSG